MTTIAFDTLKAAEGLEAAGMDARQAKAVVGTVAEAFSDTVATKADIAEVRADLKTGLAELKADMLKIAMGVAIAVILANAAMTIALIRFLA